MRIETQMKEHCKSQDEQFKTIIDCINEIKQDIKHIDDKYAGKWTEKALMGFIIGGITLIVFVLQYII